MTQKLFILIYKGEPLDYTEYRHTALYFQFASQSRSIMHIIGCQGLFQFSNNVNCDPSTLGNLVQVVPVTDIPTSIGEDSIRETVSRTPIRNGRLDLDWNCQNWVGDALNRLVHRGWITVEQRADAIDKMADACLEAHDDSDSI
ncbi:hypothetical protein ARAM_001224 [Aspergillus rambellii]|uniref:Uncharacterized protein n=1 Tax=Aspergillus rambellii TaxID=308745 RepID=A0A0F8VUF5_9EURO|nr:hypothetical protein ARAM_001224 [Aspergillus rambellii]